MIAALKPEAKRGHCYPAAGVRCDCELPHVGAGNDTLVPLSLPSSLFSESESWYNLSELTIYSFMLDFHVLKVKITKCPPPQVVSIHEAMIQCRNQRHWSKDGLSARQKMSDFPSLDMEVGDREGYGPKTNHNLSYSN